MWIAMVNFVEICMVFLAFRFYDGAFLRWRIPTMALIRCHARDAGRRPASATDVIAIDVIVTGAIVVAAADIRAARPGVLPVRRGQR
jgi:hypothetical protein